MQSFKKIYTVVTELNLFFALDFLVNGLYTAILFQRKTSFVIFCFLSWAKERTLKGDKIEFARVAAPGVSALLQRVTQYSAF